MLASSQPDIKPLFASSFARDVFAGLSGRPKSIPSKYFYDERGSRLFQQITRCDEYYLTRCESEILAVCGRQVAASLAGENLRIWEAGAGDGRKTEILLRQLLQHGHACEYVPVDICARSMAELTGSLRRRLVHPAFRLRGVVGDYFRALGTLNCRPSALPIRNLVLFLGSSIGNLDHRAARGFLRRLRRSLGPGDCVLIGFDLKKDPQILQQAYDDARGITREFNLNLLDRMNRELDAQFERDTFQHHAVYNSRRGCMESWLLSMHQQVVPVPAIEREIPFRAWEGIRTETSYKYDLDQVEKLARGSGFAVRDEFFDEKRYFVDSLWQVKPLRERGL